MHREEFSTPLVVKAALGNHLRPLVAPLRRGVKLFSKPRAENDYATHVPVLIGLARRREIRKVLEFGCGFHSTLTMLNRAAFPHLEELHSVENDASWAETIRKVAKAERRWNLSLVDGEIADRVPDLVLEDFDLILIDDSKTSVQRAATINSVVARFPQHPWIVIHDFEVDEYQKAARGFSHRYRFRSYNPETGLLCNRSFDTRSLRSLDRALKQNVSKLDPADVHGWAKLL